MFKLVAKVGKENTLKTVYEKLTVECTLKKDIKAPELYSLLFSGLSHFEKLEVDLASFKSAKLSEISSYELSLVLGTVVMHYTHEPFSLKTGKNKSKEWKIKGKLEKEVDVLLDAQKAAKQLQETPPNLMYPKSFVEFAKNMLKGCKGITINVLEKKELEKSELNLITSVGKASKHEPYLMVIKYSPSKSKDISALVGKGVCYDSGGLNVKPGSHMSNMKFDMSGAASSLATIYALAKNGSSRNCVVVLPLVENSIAGNAYKPDDVIISYSKKSVEIDNTDAEGRLVLADAISYVAENYNPKEIITIATLTGAIGYALGYKYAGAWATSEKSWNLLHKSSVKGGEWIWRMPLDDYYLKALKNTRVADIKNSARTGAGGASRAACFLKEFAKDIPFIHLDIANVAHGENDSFSYAPMVRTLYHYLSNS